MSAPIVRLDVAHWDKNGLTQTRHMMIDKLTTTPGANLTDRLGYLEAPDLNGPDRAVLALLGLAASNRTTCATNPFRPQLWP